MATVSPHPTQLRRQAIHPSSTYIFTPYVGLSAFSASLALVVGIATYNRLRADGGRFLPILMFVMVVWSGFISLDLAATDLQTKLFWAKLEYFGTSFTPYFFFLATLELNGITKWLTRLRILILAIIPSITWLLALSSPYHNLLWTSYTILPGPENMRVFGHGPWFWIGAVGYSYLLSFASGALLIRAGIRFMHPWRVQALLLFLSAVFPAIGNFLYIWELLPIRGYDPTPSLFSVSAVLFALSYYRYGLLKIPPLALHKLLNGINLSYLVIDDKSRLVYFNWAARQLLSIQGASVLRANPDKLLKIGEVLELKPEFTKENFFVEIPTPQGRRRFHGKWSSIQIWANRPHGKVLLLDDETSEQQAIFATIRQRILQERNSMLANLDDELITMLGQLQESLGQIRGNLQNGNEAAAIAQLDSLRLAAANADRNVRFSMFDILSRGDDSAQFGQVLVNYINRFQIFTGLQVMCSLPDGGIDTLLSPQSNAVLLSTIQDCLSNAAGVGKASMAQVLLSVQSEQLLCAYMDNAKERNEELVETLLPRAQKAGFGIDLRQELGATHLLITIPTSVSLIEGGNSLAGISVLLADPQELFAESFSRVLAENGLNVMGNIKSLNELVEVISDFKPAILFLSSRWPMIRIQKVLTELDKKIKHTRVVMLFDSENDEILRMAVLNGVAGFLHKDQSVTEILAAIRQVLQGGLPIAPWFTSKMTGIISTPSINRQQVAKGTLLATGLSEKQIEILKLLGQGKIYKQVAQDLTTSESAVKYHVERIQGLVGCKNRAQLIKYAIDVGLAENNSVS